MSLSFELSNINDYETVCFEETPGGRRKKPVTEALIFHTMGAGIGEITEATLDEFFARVNAREKLHGPMVTMPMVRPGDKTDWVPYFITKEDVKAHIGLATNVFPYEPRAHWAERLIATAYDLRDEPYVRAEEDGEDEI